MFAPRAAGPYWFRNSWDCRRDEAVVGRCRACDKFWSRISQGGGEGLRDSVCGRAGKGEGEGGWVKMMGRPGAPATKRNNAPNKSMAGFPFGCLVLEVGHMTVVEQGRGRGGTRQPQGWGGPIEGAAREFQAGAPRCPLHHHLQHAAARCPLHAGAIVGDDGKEAPRCRSGRSPRSPVSHSSPRSLGFSPKAQ